MESMDRPFDFLKGELLLIDKPVGWTSFDVVNKIRYMLKYMAGIPRIKVGHVGYIGPPGQRPAHRLHRTIYKADQ